ncbi:MAG TPA: HAMP domain-containing sensor histidine kinase [Dongiaceae bacterium]|nr:HAMP domain-containing sensor histidine kinase [Dongiaceae bacterium]
MKKPDVTLPGFGLSARVLVLTVLFVMVSEVLIYAPTIARFRMSWLDSKLSSAHLAIMALEAQPNYMIDPQLELKLLDHVGAYLIALHTTDGKNLMLRGASPPLIVNATIDLSDRSWTDDLGDAIDTLRQHDKRLLRVKGYADRAPDTQVEMVIDEWPLHQAMIAYSWRVLGVSVVISLITASLIFAALQWLIIRPIKRVTRRILRFRDNPEIAVDDQAVSRRSDEIGVVERELVDMAAQVRQALLQHARLAALGTAVGKINHDLRGILATARLVADRIVESDDPDVRKAAPALVRSLDRAVDLCSDTLNFTREGPPKPELSQFPLADLHSEIGESLTTQLNGSNAWLADFPSDFTLTADREQLFRIIRNLAENAFQAGARQVCLAARQDDGHTRLEVRDDGPGLPPKALQNLFVPFRGSARAGGTGLGLAIARELLRGQGGDLTLQRNGSDGATFALDLPRRPGHIAA